MNHGGAAAGNRGGAAAGNRGGAAVKVVGIVKASEDDVAAVANGDGGEECSTHHIAHLPVTHDGWRLLGEKALLMGSWSAVVCVHEYPGAIRVQSAL